MTSAFLAWASNLEDAILVDLDALLDKDAHSFQLEDGIYVDVQDAIGLADVLDDNAEMVILSAPPGGFKKKG